MCEKREILTEDDRSVEEDPLFLTDPDSIISKDEDHLRNSKLISFHGLLYILTRSLRKDVFSMYLIFYELAMFVFLQCESYKNICLLKIQKRGSTLKPHVTVK